MFIVLHFSLINVLLQQCEYFEVMNCKELTVTTTLILCQFWTFPLRDMFKVPVFHVFCMRFFVLYSETGGVLYTVIYLNCLFYFLQTVLLQNLYVNPQNSAKSADGSHCKQKFSFESLLQNLIYSLKVISDFFF